jgi:hypothetical protein
MRYSERVEGLIPPAVSGSMVPTSPYSLGIRIPAIGLRRGWLYGEVDAQSNFGLTRMMVDRGAAGGYDFW